ncbi:unnamed protein product, partial [Euphydryas editha]
VTGGGGEPARSIGSALRLAARRSVRRAARLRRRPAAGGGEDPPRCSVPRHYVTRASRSRHLSNVKRVSCYVDGVRMTPCET